MKIYVILDHPVANKTMLNVVEKWKEQGHEVQVDMYYDIEKVKWCDVIFGEYIQGAVCEAVKDESHKKPIHIRGIDIDIYYGHYMQIDWNRCKSVMFITDYMKDYAVDNYFRLSGRSIDVPVETVKLGVDLSKWTFKDRSETRGKNIGWLNKFWSGKGIELLCEIIYKVVQRDPEYKFHIVGKRVEKWSGKYFEEFLERNGLRGNVIIENSVVSVDAWMDNMDYMLSTSMKECLSLPLVEGMAKGIKPIINHWWEATELYPNNLIFETADQAVELIFNDDYNSSHYREFVSNNYNLDTEVNKLNNILNL